MKPEKRFPNAMTEAFKPKFNAPPEVVAAACDRVLHRLESADVDLLQGTENGVERVNASARWFRPVLVLSGVAAMVLVVLLTSVDSRAVVESANGGVFLVSNGQALRDGDRIEAGEVVRANGGTGVSLKLPDGSHVEMRSKSELSWERAHDGLRIQLMQGSVIVNAAKQRTGHLYVRTKDVTVSVVGTVFLVNAAEEGSSVSVIEGEVRVQQGNLETKLLAGEHVSTVPKPEPRAVKEEIAWSPKAEEHLALLQQSARQTPEAPKLQFEEAAIRPCTPEQQRGPDPAPGGRGGAGDARFIQITPGRLYARCMTLAWLIPMSHRKLLTPESQDEEASLAAKGLPLPTDSGLAMGKTYYYGTEVELNSEDFSRIRRKLSIRGGQEWIVSEGYTIEAITDGSTDALTMQRVMLWDLLERRFQVKVHTEVEQTAALALTIAPGGLKIKPFQEGECTTEKTKFPNPKPKCNQVNGGFVGTNYRLEAGNHQLGVLAFLLKGIVGAPILDRTGNTDRFSMVLNFGPDEITTPGSARECRQYGIPECIGLSTAPSIHAALSELGLKLEPIKSSREFIVVDRAERPSPN
jgi:uncharacterized protein (TIGR03435 family)